MCHVIVLQDVNSLSCNRYVNMDYLFFSALKDNPIKAINVSYDIACQWNRNLWERMKTVPPTLHQPYKDKKWMFFVPKFHLPAHIAECQWKYSFNFIKGVGRTDGEAPERGWANLNTVASSMKEMGPGHRRDTLDDMIGDSNWKKFIGFGKQLLLMSCLARCQTHRIYKGESLLQKLLEAVSECNEHQEDLREFEKSLSDQYGSQLSQWKRDVEEWENNMSKPNPFEVKPACEFCVFSL